MKISTFTRGDRTGEMDWYLKRSFWKKQSIRDFRESFCIVS